MPKMPEMSMGEPTNEDRIFDRAMKMRLLFHIPKNQPLLIWNVEEGDDQVYKLLIRGGGENEGLLH